MQMYTDKEPVRAKPLQPNIAENGYLQCYESFYRGFDKVDDYDDDDHYPIIKHGNLRLVITFAQVLQKAYKYPGV